MVYLNSLQSNAETLKKYQATRVSGGVLGELEVNLILKTIKFLERIGYTVSVCQCQCTAVSDLILLASTTKCA